MNMLKTVVTALVLTCAPVGIALADNVADSMKRQDQMFDTSVKLDLAGQGWCSGNLIHSKRDEKTGEVETFILTAKHCTDFLNQDHDIVKVIDEQHDHKLNEVRDMVYLGHVWGQSYKSDLALIKLDDHSTYFDKVAKVAPKDIVLTFGDPTYIVGFPMGLSKTFTQGTLGFIETQGQWFKELSTSGRFLRSTPDVAPGSSGSSMFVQDSDGDYKLVGVTTGSFVRSGMPFINWFTPIDEIHEYLDQASKAWKDNSDIVPKKDEAKSETTATR